MRILVFLFLAAALSSCDALGVDIGPDGSLLSGNVRNVAGPPNAGFSYDRAQTFTSLTRYSGCASYDVVRVRGRDAQGRHDVEIELHLFGLPDELPRGENLFIWTQAGEELSGYIRVNGLLPGLPAGTPALFEPESARLTLERIGRRSDLRGRLEVTARGGSLLFSASTQINRVQPTRLTARVCP